MIAAQGHGDVTNDKKTSRANRRAAALALAMEQDGDGVAMDVRESG